MTEYLVVSAKLMPSDSNFNDTGVECLMQIDTDLADPKLVGKVACVHFSYLLDGQGMSRADFRANCGRHHDTQFVDKFFTAAVRGVRDEMEKFLANKPLPINELN